MYFLKKYKILVIAHFFTTGPPQEMVDFLKDKVSSIVFMEHPFSYALSKHSSIKIYKNGEVVERVKGPRAFGPDIFYFLKDFLFTIFFVLKTRKEFDICIAADNLNALSAIVLKKFRKIKNIIYYTIDYTPRRFDNPIINWIYYKIDKVCCYNTDLIWNSSELIDNLREKKCIFRKKSAHQIIVPDGSNFKRIKRFTFENINRHYIVFMGHLIKNKGIEMLLEAFSEVYKIIKKARLIIIGTGELERKLKKQAKRLEISRGIFFTGYIKDHSKIENIMAKCAIAVAPYIPELNSFSFYSDVGKPKAYLACGLPVIITKVPKIAYKIQKEKAGIVIDYNKEKLVSSIVKLLENDNLFRSKKKQFDDK